MHKDTSADTNIASDCRIMWKKKQKKNNNIRNKRSNSNREITKEQKESSSTACILKAQTYTKTNERTCAIHIRLLMHTHPFVWLLKRDWRIKLSFDINSGVFGNTSYRAEREWITRALFHTPDIHTRSHQSSHRCFMHTWPSVDNAYCINWSCFINLICLSLCLTIDRSYGKFFDNYFLNLFLFSFSPVWWSSIFDIQSDKTVQTNAFFICATPKYAVDRIYIVLNNAFFPTRLMPFHQTASPIYLFCLHPLCD